MTISKELDGGFDGKVRFPQLEEEFCQGLLDQKIYKVDIGPLLLAIKARNPKAVSHVLKMDKYVNLLEALKGPKDIYMKDYDKQDQFWNYKFVFHNESNKTMTLPF